MRFNVKFFLLLVFGNLLFSPVMASGESSVKRWVTVDGFGEIKAIPDEASLNFSVEKRLATVAEAQAEVSGIVAKLMTLLKSEAIREKDIQSTGMHVQPNYQWNRKAERQELIGYIVRRSVRVHLRDLSRLGRVMQAAVEVGVTQVQPPNLQFSNRELLLQQALSKAAANARDKARVLAETLGAQLGSVQNIQASASPRPAPVYREQMMMRASAAPSVSQDQSWNPGEQELSASVTVQFSLLGR